MAAYLWINVFVFLTELQMENCDLGNICWLILEKNATLWDLASGASMSTESYSCASLSRIVLQSIKLKQMLQSWMALWG